MVIADAIATPTVPSHDWIHSIRDTSHSKKNVFPSIELFLLFSVTDHLLNSKKFIFSKPVGSGIVHI